MTEKNMRRRIVAALRQLGAFSVENPALPGTPDVAYIRGWIELKQAAKWPGGGAPLKIKHFSNQQKVFLRRWTAAKGTAYLLLHVDGDWLLLEGSVAAKNLGTSSREELIAMCYRSWHGELNEKELRECL